MCNHFVKNPTINDRNQAYRLAHYIAVARRMGANSLRVFMVIPPIYQPCISTVKICFCYTRAVIIIQVKFLYI